MLWCLSFVCIVLNFFDFCVVAHHLLAWVATVNKINIIMVKCENTYLYRAVFKNGFYRLIMHILCVECIKLIKCFRRILVENMDAVLHTWDFLDPSGTISSIPSKHSSATAILIPNFWYHVQRIASDTGYKPPIKCEFLRHMNSAKAQSKSRHLSKYSDAEWLQRIPLHQMSIKYFVYFLSKIGCLNKLSWKSYW